MCFFRTIYSKCWLEIQGTNFKSEARGDGPEKEKSEIADKERQNDCKTSYSSTHNHGPVEDACFSKISFLSIRVILHVHDSGRKL